MGKPDIVDRLASVVEPVVGPLGLDVEAIELTKAGKRSVLRVAIDKDGGVDMDDVAEATRAVSEALDSADVMGQTPYTLEVSSPGVDRPLRLPRHWRRNAGRLVKVSLVDSEGPGGSLTGRIAEVDDHGAEVEVDGERVRVAFAEVAKAKIQVEFKPGSSPADRED